MRREKTAMAANWTLVAPTGPTLGPDARNAAYLDVQSGFHSMQQD
jgi:hypothetical protein